MTERDAFLAAITTTSMRMPALIYADWLEERGDPRGEFIRAQCELKQTPCGHPRAGRADGAVEQLDRHATWRAELPGLPGVTWEALRARLRRFRFGQSITAFRVPPTAFSRQPPSIPCPSRSDDRILAGVSRYATGLAPRLQLDWTGSLSPPSTMRVWLRRPTSSTSSPSICRTITRPSCSGNWSLRPCWHVSASPGGGWWGGFSCCAPRLLSAPEPAGRLDLSAGIEAVSPLSACALADSPRLAKLTHLNLTRHDQRRARCLARSPHLGRLARLELEDTGWGRRR
jgi:uncharacterized protein (TIGR02996 family)